MKKIAYLLTFIAAVFITGCESDEYRDFYSTQVKIISSDVIFSAAGGTGSIEVEGTQVTVVSDQAWCKPNVSGNTIAVSVEPNISKLGRTALITIKDRDKINYVPVTQTPLYIHLDSYEPVNFLGIGGEISFPYESDAPVIGKSDASWLTCHSQNGMIVLQAAKNPELSKTRSATLTLIAGGDQTSLNLTVTQEAWITSVDPDPNANAVADFLNLNNYNETSSRYKITYFSAGMTSLYENLKKAYPLFREMRIEAPRGSYKLSVILYNLDGSTASYYYWNATNGLVPVNGSQSVAAFQFSGDTYGGTQAPYTSNANYSQLRAIFASAAGFTIIPDGNDFWFRSEENPVNYFKAEPASW